MTRGEEHGSDCGAGLFSSNPTIQSSVESSLAKSGDAHAGRQSPLSWRGAQGKLLSPRL